METFKMTPNVNVNLRVKINSVAIVGSNVSLDDTMIRSSKAYEYTVSLGNSNDLDGKTLSGVANFKVPIGGNVNAIMAATTVDYTLTQGGNSKTFQGTKVKINNSLFMAFVLIKLTL